MSIKPETKKGVLQEIIYLSVAIAITTTLGSIGIIEENKIWLCTSFLILLPTPLRKRDFIDFKSFTWRNWKMYLLHTSFLIAFLLIIEQIVY